MKHDEKMKIANNRWGTPKEEVFDHGPSGFQMTENSKISKSRQKSRKQLKIDERTGEKTWNRPTKWRAYFGDQKYTSTFLPGEQNFNTEIIFEHPEKVTQKEVIDMNEVKADNSKISNILMVGSSEAGKS